MLLGSWLLVLGKGDRGNDDEDGRRGRDGKVGKCLQSIYFFVDVKKYAPSVRILII